MKDLNEISKALSHDAPAGGQAVEREILDLFVDLGRAFGMPRSLGAIYGFLFISPAAVTFDEIVQNVLLSTGSVSQGLKLLRAVGAARITFVPGDRRDHYVAETRLRHLLGGLLEGNLERSFRGASGRLTQVLEMLDAGAPSSPSLRERVRTLESWHAQARNVVPALLSVLSAPGK